MLRIKLVKAGKKDRPTWKVIVVEKSKTGKGFANDYIGSYNPHANPKDFKLDIEKYDKWVKNGAQPTDSVKRLKGRFIDKTKDYQEEVGTKVYKSKKPEEEKPKGVPSGNPEAPKPVESAPEAEASEPVAEVAEEVKEEVVEKEAVAEEVAEEKEEKKDDSGEEKAE